MAVTSVPTRGVSSLALHGTPGEWVRVRLVLFERGCMGVELGLGLGSGLEFTLGEG